MRKIFILILVIFIISNYSCIHSKIIRYDGIYQSKEDDEYTKYFRFYADRTVIYVPSTGKVNQISKWFEKENFIEDHHCIGKYNIKRKKINFETTAKGYGTVIYKGYFINEHQIKVKSKSLINGHESIDTISFVKIENWK